jgi:hypothetical protein
MFKDNFEFGFRETTVKTAIIKNKSDSDSEDSVDEECV